MYGCYFYFESYIYCQSEHFLNTTITLLGISTPYTESTLKTTTHGESLCFVGRLFLQ